MSNKRILAVFILPLILGSFLTYPSNASAATGITIAPVKYKLDVERGQVIENTITVANPNDFVLKIRAEFQDFKVTENNDIQWLPGDLENTYKMSDWIRIRQDVITLKPKEEQSVPFKISVHFQICLMGILG